VYDALKVIKAIYAGERVYITEKMSIYKFLSKENPELLAEMRPYLTLPEDCLFELGQYGMEDAGWTKDPKRPGVWKMWKSGTVPGFRLHEFAEKERKGHEEWCKRHLLIRPAGWKHKEGSPEDLAYLAEHPNDN
jgi:hypothetical protein